MPDQPELRQQLAEVLLEHTARHDNNGVDLWLWCGCGDGVRYYDRRKHGAHVAEQLLALPGIAIVSADDIRRALRHMDPAASLDEQRLRAKAQLALLAAADAAEAQTNATEAVDQ